MTTSPVLARNSIPIWTLRKEASLNWLAFGLLLAAWNASYNEVPEGGARRRPQALRGYSQVSVRALQRMTDVAVSGSKLTTPPSALAVARL